MKVVQCVDAYIARKRVSGFAYRATGKILWRFARYVGDAHVATIRDRDLERFLILNAVSNNTWRRYASCLGRFFTYWFARRQLKQIPRARQRPATKTAFFPFIYSRDEIGRLVDTSLARQRYPRSLLTAEAFRTILLLVYGTGMRISDVLNISDSDVDFDNKTILIQSGHPQLARKIPIGKDVVRLLWLYLTTPGRAQFGRGKALFLTRSGKRVPYAIVGHAFRRLRQFAGVSRPNSSYEPRIQDLRHSFAVHSIATWERKGLSTEKMLPILAAYMGNVNLEGFERYLQLAPQSYNRQLTQLS